MLQPLAGKRVNLFPVRVQTVGEKKDRRDNVSSIGNDGLLCAGPEKAAEQLLFPSLFAPLLGQCQKWKRKTEEEKKPIKDSLLFTIDHSPFTP